MPQLDYTTFSSQLFWLVVSFSLLLMFVSLFVSPRLNNIFQARKDRIDGDLLDAKEFQAQAEKFRLEYEAALESSRSQAIALISDATERMIELEKKRTREIEATVDKKLAEADVRIEKSKAEAVKSVNEIATQVMVSILDKISDAKVDKKQVESYINKAMN